MVILELETSRIPQLVLENILLVAKLPEFMKTLELSVELISINYPRNFTLHLIPDY